MTNQKKTISGFSKLSKRGKIKWIVENFFKDPENVMRELKSYMLDNEEHQKILDEISENTISNYHLPYGVAPNFVMNGETYCVPMVTEESSVVAGAAAAAKYWMTRGGFHAEVISTIKLGQIHFFFDGPSHELAGVIPDLKIWLLEHASDLTANMRKRGGGILDIILRDFSLDMEDYYQLMVSFETCDSMGANFINSVLERFTSLLPAFIQDLFSGKYHVEILMSILSNYTPESLVRTWVACSVADLGSFKGGITAAEFAERFCDAVRIAEIDVYRAATHNKGILNGIDSVVLATGNDFRAVEACAHTYAARSGKYRSLSHCTIDNDTFRFSLEIPLALGTVGGLTSLHPIAKRSFELLGNPSATTLMMIVAATGLAQNFAAVRSLVTTGIQQGHMRMHLANILSRLGATEVEKQNAFVWFSDKTVSVAHVRSFLESQRNMPVVQPK
ncbi:MAG TPA: hydroxymethylglutaryl-CoA reductase, degradative [Saprospiraceae bacterium]|nr:hydroxymethylglutaryl-CoA reductase, degradative [Saprospiraceae bacterium]